MKTMNIQKPDLSETYTIRRKNKNGFIETTTYHGSLKEKPNGWRVAR